MATLTTLADRLRSELGDLPKSFVWQTTADGTTNRFLVPYSPIDGATLLVTVNGIDVSTSVDVEETTGYINFDVIPAANATILVVGKYFRYFTDAEICQFIDTAFGEHTANHADPYGRAVTLLNLPGIEEYPVVVYASTLALYTLATDASFDIDITAPDGVTIPRSERYRQLMEMIQARKEQYKELCSLLGIGMFKIDVFTLRRTSKTTNRYVPVYLPQEVDDRSMPQRALLSMPSYGSAISPSDVPTFDLVAYQGDSFEVYLQFAFDVTGYNFKADIVQVWGSPVPIGSFTVDFVPGEPTKLKLSLTSTQSNDLPERCFWDIQATSDNDPSYEKTYMRGALFVTRQATV